MLTITVPGTELWDERTETFISSKSVTLELEHSLVSLSKWEQVFEKPFLAKTDKSTAETYGYFKAMCLTPNVDDEVFTRLSDENHSQINEYLDAKMTATTFKELPGQRSNPSGETITSELIYYWLVAFNIPFEVENWHLNRLFTLIRVCNIKNGPQKKMSRRDAAAQQRALNEQRRAQFKTSG